MRFTLAKAFSLGILCWTGDVATAQITSSQPQNSVTISSQPQAADTAIVITNPSINDPKPAVAEPAWLIDPSIVQPRLQALQKEIQLTYNSVTHQFVEYFAYRKPSFTKTMMERKDLYFPLYEKYLKKYGLPDELKYLSLIESGLNPKAISRAGAGGLWQFMPKTARIDFGLRIDEYVDERFDPERATEAACRYMKQLYNIFGDWQLVLASYNTGPGNVRRAIRRCSGGQTFWDIYNCLPRETRGYVPQYIGIIYMMNHGADHDIAPEMLETAIPNDTILVNGFLDIDKLASLSNINLENIQKLNPHILTHILPGSTRNFPLRLPREEMAYLVANRKTVFDSLSKVSPSVIEQLAPAPEVMVASNSNGPILTEEETKKGKVTVEEDIEDVVINKKPKKKVYVVRRGDNLTSIASKYDVDVYDIKVWNHLRKSTLHAGDKLVIFKEVAVTSSVKYAKASNVERESVHKGKARFHFVQEGDTLWNISQRYGGLSIDKIKKLNGIKGNVVKAGMKIRVS